MTSNSRFKTRSWAANRSRSSPGYGLGLSYVQSVAHAHGGRVEVRSQPGRGSTFRIALPFEDRVEPRDITSPELS